ncbi:MAG: hypothetical protein ABS95_00770 [Verrucomicrobia bacterium SCN 57-15]|nr:MAG: hypothetical protein ABS95_00770 [Verrucomicrobia bacterium SCN 57-15]
MKTKLTIGLLALALAAVGVSAQETNAPNAPSDKYVTREEYDKVIKKLEALEKKLGSMDEQKAAEAKEKTAAAKELEETQDDFDKQLKQIKSLATSAQPGTTRPLITGWAGVGFEDRKGEKSTFSGSFDPILLWKLNDRLFFEGELEFEWMDNETEVNLEYANLSYIVNDYLTLKGGRFLTPFGTFADRLHPGWINKLPDAPLPFAEEGGIAPTSSLGLQASGGFPVGSTKFNYAVYVENGPKLNTTDPGEAGRLEFDNLTDINNNKGVGTRIGFLPIPELELGYSFQYAKVGEDVDANAYLHAVDLNYVRSCPHLKGVVDVKAQWMWSKVSDVTYDTGSGPFTFNNRRDGGYAQLAYRPSLVKNKFLQNLEGVCRWDMINNPSGAPAESAFDEQRWTLGLNYWLGSSTVVKAAYQFGDRRTPGEGRENVNAILFQAAMGF